MLARYRSSLSCLRAARSESEQLQRGERDRISPRGDLSAAIGSAAIAIGPGAAAAERHTSGDTLRMATKLLDDYRRSALGAIALEFPTSPVGAP